jgi:hypothetical protein
MSEPDDDPRINLIEAFRGQAIDLRDTHGSAAVGWAIVLFYLLTSEAHPSGGTAVAALIAGCFTSWHVRGLASLWRAGR